MEKYPESRKKYKREYYEKNKNRIKEYYEKNKDKIKKNRREWEKKNKDKMKEYAREYSRRWREENRQKSREYMRIYQKEYIKKYYKTDKYKAVIRNANNKRRAKVKQTDITAQYLVDLKQNTTRCGICGRKLKDNAHLDHIIPLNIGGTHTKSNVRYVHAKCNLQRPKNGSDILKFMKLTCEPDKWAEETDDGKYEEVEIFALICDNVIASLRFHRANLDL